MWQKLRESVDSGDARIAVVGLGYVGLPLAVSFAREGFKVIGFDVSSKRIRELQDFCDRTLEVPADELRKIADKLVLTDEPSILGEADFVLISVPTPLTKSKQPDMKFVSSAAETVGRFLRAGQVIVLESTVYPGATEEVVVPALEARSGLTCGRDFKVGFSPERINPGDRKHRIENIVKVISGTDDTTVHLLEALYGKVAKAGVFAAKNIRSAEMSKLVENIQRDVNIALMNELAMLCEKLGISVWDVIDAAATKWNFNDYSPGLVGGYCIPVNPFYLTYKAQEVGHNAEVILAGRRINDGMPHYISQLVLKALNGVGKTSKGAKVLLLGLAFKGNVPDVRTSQTRVLINELQAMGAHVSGYDPLVDEAEVGRELGIPLEKEVGGINGVDAVILLTSHDVFRSLPIKSIRGMMGSSPVLIDTKRFFKHSEVEAAGILYKGL